MSAPRRYAEGTKVSVESSRGEITGILTKHGIERIAQMVGPDGDQIVFEMAGNSYRLTMTKPTPESLRVRDGKLYAYPNNVDWRGKADAEWRRVWRANVLLLKAKLEFIDSGDTTIERELMPYLLVDGRRTLEDVFSAGEMPMLVAGVR